MQAAVLARNAMLDAFGTHVGALFTLDVRTGAAPGVGNADTGTLLATLTAGSFGTAAAGAVTFSATADSQGDADGTPGHVRMKTSGGTAKAEFTAGLGTAATLGTVTLTLTAITDVAITDGGTGYVDGVAYPITFSGGTSTRTGAAYVTSTAGILTTVTVIDGGDYSVAPTATVGLPHEFTFTDTVHLGGQVSLTSASLTAGNANI